MWRALAAGQGTSRENSVDTESHDNANVVTLNGSQIASKLSHSPRKLKFAVPQRAALVVAAAGSEFMQMSRSQTRAKQYPNICSLKLCQTVWFFELVIKPKLQYPDRQVSFTFFSISAVSHVNLCLCARKMKTKINGRSRDYFSQCQLAKNFSNYIKKMSKLKITIGAWFSLLWVRKAFFSLAQFLIDANVACGQN